MSEKLNYIKNKNTENLQINDLIKLGLYSLLLIILMGVGLGVCSLVFSLLFKGKYYFAIFTTVGTSFFAAPAYTLIFHKINKKYTIFILSFIVGIFLLLAGHLAMAFVINVASGVVAEYFFRKDSEYISYIFFTLGGLGTLLPLYFMKDKYILYLQSRNFSQEKIDFIMTNSSINIFLVVILLTLVFSVLGTYFSRKMYFKNFNKAGI